MAIGRLVKQQPSIMGYADAFFLLRLTMLFALVATVSLRKPENLGTDGH